MEVCANEARPAIVSNLYRTLTSMAEEDGRTSLALLEARLRRLEFLLNGSSDLNGIPYTVAQPAANESVSARLVNLEDELRKLTTKSVIVQDLMRLYSRYPDLFHKKTNDEPTELSDPSTVASIILAHASLFPETSSRLSSLKTLPIPEASASNQLLNLQSRLKRATEQQAYQDIETAELRARSARVMEWWVNTGVVDLGECWADWEARVRQCGRTVSVLEGRQVRDTN